MSGGRLKKWRAAVKARDGYTCQRCGSTANLHAHHIQTQRNRPDLIFDADNGETLCDVCHGRHHSRPGHPLSLETRQKISDAKMGHPVSPETRRRIGAATRVALTGRHLSPETRRKISDANRARWARRSVYLWVNRVEAA